MKIEYHYLEQQTEEWFAIRAGRITASNARAILTNPKSKADKEAGVLSETTKKYLYQRLQEKMSGLPEPGFTSAATAWGNENEPWARDMYEKITGNKVDKAGFATYGDHAGASTDGLVSFDGIIEIKCPYTEFLQRVSEDIFEHKDYYPQIQMGLLCTGRKYCDYVVADPRMPEGNQIFIQRIYRDENLIKELETRISRAIEWMTAEEKQLKKKFKDSLNFKG